MSNNILEFTTNFTNKFYLNDDLDSNSKKNQYFIALIQCGAIIASLTSFTQDMKDNIFNWFNIINIKEFPIDRLLDKYTKTPDISWLNNFYKEENSPFIPNLLFYSSLATLLNDHSLSSEQINIGLNFLREVEKTLSLDREFTLSIRGWLTNKADSDINNIIDQVFESIKDESIKSDNTIDLLFEQLKKSKKTIEVNTKIDEKEWERIKANLSKSLDKLAVSLKDFNLDLYQLNEFVQVKNYIENSLFRISILGEFKRGKSTLINSLLDTIKLVPAATLPCTSGLIEVKYGSTEKYYLNDEGPLGKYNEITKYDFINNSGNAHSNIEIREKSSKDYNPEKINRWKVEYNSKFLKDYQIELIDTPGLNESPLRDLMSIEEAQYTDAAIFVLDATHQAALTELNFLEKIKSLSKNIIFAVNRGDLVKSSDRDEIIPYCYNRVKAILPDIPKKNFVLISSIAIENKLNKKNSEDQEYWTKQFDHLKKTINNHLLKNSAPKRLEKITLMINSLNLKINELLDNLLEEKKYYLNQLDELDNKYENQEKQKIELINDIKIAAENIKNGWQNCSSKLSNVVTEDVLPTSIKNLSNDMTNWSSEHSPIFSGKKYITDIANIAQDRIQTFIKESISEKANHIVLEEIEISLNNASNKIENKLENYLKDSKKNPEEILEEVKKKTFENFIEISGMNLDPSGEIFFGSAIATLLSAIIGYIVADVILYYILGVISGFLNPYLLAAAVLLMIGGLIWKGRDFVGSFIKQKVYNNFSEKLLNKDTKEKITLEINNNIKKVFSQISESFSSSANNVINEIDYHRKNIKLELKELTEKIGTNRENLEEIVNKMSSDKEKAQEILSSITSDITNVTSEEKNLLLTASYNK